jgi:hypothetical protein
MRGVARPCFTQHIVEPTLLTMKIDALTTDMPLLRRHDGHGDKPAGIGFASDRMPGRSRATLPGAWLAAHKIDSPEGVSLP